MQEIKSNVCLKNFDIEDELFFSVSSFIYKSLKNDVNEKQIIHKITRTLLTRDMVFPSYNMIVCITYFHKLALSLQARVQAFKPRGLFTSR